MFNTKKIFTNYLVGVTSVLLIAAQPTPTRGATDTETIGEPVTLQALAHTNATDEEFIPLSETVRTFNNSQRKFRVELIPSPSRTLSKKIFSAAATGTLPCLFEIDGPYIAQFARPGYLRKLDDFISPALREDLLPSVIDQGIYGNHIYALGQFDSGLGLWANKRHLKAAGVRIPTLKSPWNLDEFEQSMDRLMALKGIDYALQLNIIQSPPEFLTYAYSPILQGFGGGLIDRTTMASASGVLDSPQSVAAMTRFQSWIQKGWSGAKAEQHDAFARGEAALSWTGHWEYKYYQEMLGDDLILLPLPDFGRGIKTGMGSWTWAISNTCKYPEGAWAFVEHVLSPEEILRMTVINGAVPARKSVSSQLPLYKNDGPLRLFQEQLSQGKGVPRPASAFYDVITLAFSKAVKQIAAGNGVHTELSRAAKTIDEHIVKNTPKVSN